jgi:hypothetical protein
VASSTYATLQHILQAVAYRRVAPGLLDVFLRLFDGHDIPALFWAQERRPGFYKSPGMNRALTFEAHLLGAVLAGSYPFQGVRVGCDCEPGAHVCDGSGCNYLCLDLDAHKGETDTEARCRRLLVTAWRVGLLPVVFSSRSGRGAHVYIFLTESVTTREAHAAGIALARAAGIHDRCDVIPSGEHQSGLGTLHALPCSPMSEPGGGVLFDSNLTPIADDTTMVSLLQWADTRRTPAHFIRELAAGRLVPQSLSVASPTVNPSPLVGAMTTARSQVALDRKAQSTPEDAALLSLIRKHHPQFKRALATPPEAWKGKRSSRDSYLMSYLRRQGMTPAGIVVTMCSLPQTKASERGAEFAWTMLEAQTGHRVYAPSLAGQPLGVSESKAMRLAAPWAPWAVRVPPPQHYDGHQNPWWTARVQERLAGARSGLDGILLGYLVDHYYRGPIKRRMFYVSQRALAKTLGYPVRTVGVAVRRLAERFSDVLRVVPGVSHPTLRIANGFYVPERGHQDALSWYAAVPGRVAQGTL